MSFNETDATFPKPSSSYAVKYKHNWRKRGSISNWRGNTINYRGNYFGRKRNYSDTSLDSCTNSLTSQSDDGLSQLQIPAQNDIRILLPPVHCPYKGWHLYMTEFYRNELDTVKHLSAAEDYFKSHTEFLKEVEKKNSILVDFKKAFEDDNIQKCFPNFKEMLDDDPQKVINIFGLAAHQAVTNAVEKSLKENARQVLTDSNSVSKIDNSNLLKETLPIIHARFVNLDKILPLKNLKASYYGKLVSVKGTVVRLSGIKPYCKQMAFKCTNCFVVQGLVQPEGKYRIPSSCPGECCQSRSFSPNFCHKLTQTIDFQTLKLQEIINDNHNGGRVPRVIEVELKDDLVDTCVPGDQLTITGIVKVKESAENKWSKKDKSSLYSLFVDANSIVNPKSGSEAIHSTANIEFTMKDYYAIEKIFGEKDLFKLLVASLCPLIYGHEMVKAGLLLGLFGGVSRNEEGGVPIRGSPHILIVGDPGLGKSQMLQACANIAPRGVYVCGNTTTQSGLTVTLSREAGGDYALEGGALVLANQGVCCIDEFDKMTNQHQALLEAMEQQSISIAKAGIVCSLPARATILAAANPAGGHYDKGKTVSENIKMSGPLLSRFDLVFILLDTPDEELDSLLSEHVMALHRKKVDDSPLTTPTSTPILENFRAGSQTGTPFSTRDQFLNTPSGVYEKPLSSLLKYRKGEEAELIPGQLIRKYICYARKYVNIIVIEDNPIYVVYCAHFGGNQKSLPILVPKPKLTPESASVIQNFYLQLRQKLQNSDTTPITTRQLESIIRLAEARARCELREEVTQKDAHDVIEVMKYAMIDTYSDQFGVIDLQRSQMGTGSSNRSQIKKFISGLHKLAKSTSKCLFLVDEMKQLSRQLGLNIRDFDDFISKLNQHGYLLKKGPKAYQLLTAE